MAETYADLGKRFSVPQGTHGCGLQLLHSQRPSLRGPKCGRDACDDGEVMRWKVCPKHGDFATVGHGGIKTKVSEP